MKQNRITKLVTAAMLVALGTAVSFVSEMIPFLNLPWGGTITLASLLPLIIISYLYGISWGLGSAFIYSLLQMAVGFRTVSALFLPNSDSYMGLGFALCILLLDYILAFTAIGLGGIFRKKLSLRPALIFGSLVSLFLCYLFHVISGAIFYGAWATWFFEESSFSVLNISRIIRENISGTALSILYSVIYNGLYMLPELIITTTAAAAVSKLPFMKKTANEVKN